MVGHVITALDLAHYEYLHYALADSGGLVSTVLVCTEAAWLRQRCRWLQRRIRSYCERLAAGGSLAPRK